MKMVWRSGFLALLASGAAMAQAPVANIAPGVAQEARRLPGLQAPGSIIIDHWGIPHIRAANARDAFFLQGYAAARDRLWQIDLWRKRGLGRLAASLGPAFVAQDRASRLFLYRGDMAAEWAAYPAEAKSWTEAFAAGVSAYVGEVEAGRAPLPEEFAATGSRPERWQAEDIVRIRSNALVSNLPGEVARARAICAAGLDRERLRRALEPVHSIDMPKGFDPCSVPANVLDDYRLGTGGVSFEAGKVTVQDAPSTIAAYENPDIADGSNNWVVAPGRTATGRPILAGDPHRAHGAPSLRYVAHLDAPGLHIAGAGEPALPGLSFGHNEDIAWGLTIFAIDQQDMVVNMPAGSGAYRAMGKPVAYTVVSETIEVKGEAPRTVELRFTSDGPVIHTDPRTGRTYSLRATWDRPGASAYFNSAWLFRAKSWDDFLVARSHWGAPPLNLVFASTAGDIGWAAAGFVPVRSGSADGLLPAMRDLAPAWKGWMPAADLPAVHNPAKGWFATANAYNLPADYPVAQRLISYEWTDPSRIDRISEVMAAKPKFSLEDAMALQTDQTSALAQRAVLLLQGLDSDDPDARSALALLKGWNGLEDARSMAAPLFEVWIQRHLGAAAVAAAVPAAARAGFGVPSVTSVLALIKAGDPLLGPDPRAILTSSLASAWRETAKLLGPDPARWSWGQLHKAQIEPDLPIAGRDDARSLGPLPIGGSGSTPMAAGSSRDDFIVRHGASVRMVLDVGAWDNSMITNSPGQSGEADSVHYRDLFPIWAGGSYVPFRWTPEAVMHDAERVISATPGG